MTSSNNSSQTLASKDIASSIGTPEDRKAYRQYRIRKTKNVVQKAIAQQLKFPHYVVELSNKFLSDPDNMDVSKIEILHMKCSHALSGEAGSASDSESETKPNEPIRYKKSKLARL